MTAKPAAGVAGDAMLLSSPTNPLVAFRVVLSAGSQDDPPGKEGLAALPPRWSPKGARSR